MEEYEKFGMKEKMSKSEMKKVRTAIEHQKEVDELKNIPKKLQVIDTRIPRKAKKRVSYLYAFPKTGVSYVDQESTSSEYSSDDEMDFK